MLSFNVTELQPKDVEMQARMYFYHDLWSNEFEITHPKVDKVQSFNLELIFSNRIFAVGVLRRGHGKYRFTYNNRVWIIELNIFIMCVIFSICVFNESKILLCDINNFTTRFTTEKLCNFWKCGHEIQNQCRYLQFESISQQVSQRVIREIIFSRRF